MLILLLINNNSLKKASDKFNCPFINGIAYKNNFDSLNTMLIINPDYSIRIVGKDSKVVGTSNMTVSKILKMADQFIVVSTI